MDFQVLGPLRALEGDGEVDLGGPKQRLVLAILLAARGASVSTEALIDGVWMDDAPPTARKTLQGYIHHLRNRISGGLETDKVGYTLDVADRQVDDRCFSAALEAARPLIETDPSHASDALTAALALWRGRPFADLEGAPVLLPEITRLTEARLAALGGRIDADLALGRHDMLIGELESLTVDYPFQERFWAQHMLALYRTGRQGDALRAFSRARTQFIDEMGIEPSETLRQLEHKILDRDPSLDLAVVESPSAARAIRGYELRELVATDEIGSLYRGYQRSVGREVAIRVIESRAADDPAFIARYQSDIARVAQLDHPNIISVHDTWREPGRAYLVMRWIDGIRLDAYLAADRPSDWTALQMLGQIADALAVAHHEGVVHGDLRARAVVRSSDGRSHLTDFVIGRPPGDEADDRAAFARLAFHVLFGVEPHANSGGDLLDHTVTSSGLRATFERAFASEGCEPHDLVRAIRRHLGGDVVELAEEPESLERTDVRNPFKGLQAFHSADASDFFGRDELVVRLRQLLVRRRLVAVVGPSGSGKSSLVKAGVLPLLLQDDSPPLVAEFYPGTYPFEAMARALRSVAVKDGTITEELMADRYGLGRVLCAVLPEEAPDLLLVIDQFEELFASAIAEPVRALFLDSLVAAVTDPNSRLRVMITLRADFFDRPLRYADFGSLVEAGLMPVAMPDDSGLAAAIEQPAAAVGVRVQSGLVGEIVRDVIDEPGGLPLLQYALTELFERRETDILTVDAYRASGGVLGSVARRAEELFADLDPAGQWAMRQAFLRMVMVDEGAEDVRRRVTHADLRALEVDGEALEEGLQRFGAHRLVTFDSDPVSRAPTVEVAHESLLREWDRLHRWIDEQRDQLVVRKRLDAAVLEWQESGEDPAYLLRGRRLAQFDGWAAATEMALSSDERAFLQSSRERDEADLQSASARRRRVTILLVAAATVAIGFGIYALLQRNELADEAFASETGRLGSDAGFVVERDRQSALLMAVEAYHRDPGLEGLSALQRVLVDAGPFLGTVGAGNDYLDARWVTNERLLAVTDDEVHVLDAQDRTVIVLPIDLGPEDLADLGAADIRATSPTGLAVVSAADERALLVDVNTASVVPFPAADGNSAAAITDDGTTIALGWSDGHVELIDRQSGDLIASAPANPARDASDVTVVTGVTLDEATPLGGIDGLTFDSSGERLVTAGGVFLRAWHTDDLTPVGTEIVHAQGVDDFNLFAARPERFWFDTEAPDVVVVVDESGVVRWNVATGDRVSITSVAGGLHDADHAEPGMALLLTDDGRMTRHTLEDLNRVETLLTRSADLVFDAQETEVPAISVSPDRTRAAMATDDGLAIVALDGTRLLARAVPIGTSDTPTVTPDGKTLAAGLVSDGLYDLDTEPPTRVTFDVDVEVAQFAGSPARFDLLDAGNVDAILWTSDFVEMRNGHDLSSGDYLGDFWGSFVPAWSDDGQRVARARRSGGTVVTDRDSESESYTSSASMTSADFDAAGQRVVLVSEEEMASRVVDLASGDEVALPEMASAIVSASFTPDDAQIVTVDEGGSVWVVDATSMTLVRELEEAGPREIDPTPPPVFDPSGTVMFSASDGVARLWHFETGRQIGKPFPTDAGGRPMAVADAEAMRVVTPHERNALLWDLEVEQWIDIACRAAGRNMTETEWAVFGPRDSDDRVTCPQ